jgi:hypothetical protein
MLFEEAAPTEWVLSSHLAVGETTKLIQAKINRKEQSIDKWRDV